MTLQWTLAAGFLYAEIGVITLFCLPFISPSRWNRIFKSRFISSVFGYGNFYFNVVVIVMCLLLADSLREMYKYNQIDISPMNMANNPQAETLVHMKMFRAQRNFYISGFSLFLLIVLRQVVRLLSRLAVSEASAEASIRQAQAASDQCQRVMKENDDLKKDKKDDKNTKDTKVENVENKEADVDVINSLKTELDIKNKELTEKSKDLEKTKKDLNAFKDQAQGVTREYDRLLEEHSKIQAQLEKTDEDTKKDD